ncbi:SRPBCC family protein [Streptacidiphilus neutrinimicus]|uniref:SRPBCC family protein n=1 Tax=Streptacidiphilus neutrinimicus TaxID=105420 RepID=UPI0005A6FF82|nr:SRPBCC family protein [Streptacidiphilus neutrinimicus]
MTSAGRESVSVRTEIAAAPDAVWAAVSDVTRMGEWSPECTGADWRGAPAGPVLGARFRGRNRKGGIRWSTVCRVVEAEPGRAFAWDVSFGPIPVARWGFRLTPGDPDGGATLVEQFWQDRRDRLSAWTTETVLRTGDRADWNRRNMTLTLAALKRSLEADPAAAAAQDH